MCGTTSFGNETPLSFSFAMAGQSIYLEMCGPNPDLNPDPDFRRMSEMKDSREFPKALKTALPLMCVLENFFADSLPGSWSTFSSVSRVTTIWCTGGKMKRRRF